ncbi:hypothetical protein [Methylocucumis oryzae]|nr:hypothetical protein [Methylocucumis oryzae]
MFRMLLEIALVLGVLSGLFYMMRTLQKEQNEDRQALNKTTSDVE